MVSLWLGAQKSDLGAKGGVERRRVVVEMSFESIESISVECVRPVSVEKPKRHWIGVNLFKYTMCS